MRDWWRALRDPYDTLHLNAQVAGVAAILFVILVGVGLATGTLSP